MNSDRPRLCPPWLSGLIALGIVLALAAAYPRGGMQARLLAASPPSEVTVAYIEAWLRIEPNSPTYLSLLVDQYMGLGQWEKAELAAQKLALMGGEDGRARALLIQLTAAERRAYAVRPDDPQRPALMVKYIALLERTTQRTWDVPVMRELAAKARAAGATGVMLHFYRELAAADSANRAEWDEKLATEALAQQSYADAANAYFAAQDAAQTLPDKRRYFIAALKVLVSGNQVGQACDEAAKRIGVLAEDPQTLRYLIGLARQAHRTDLMKRYARALGQLSSLEPAGPHVATFAAANSPGTARHRPVYLDGYEASLRGVRFGGARLRLIAATAPAGANAVTPSDYDLAFKAFVESGALDDAEKLAEQALAHHLDPLVWTRRLAQVAQWNNHPALALKYWLAFARDSGNDEAWQNVLKLAPQLDDDTAYVAALTQEADRQPANLALKDQLINAYERLGQPQQALDYLKQRAVGAQREPLLERYALVAERAGQDNEALRTYRVLQTEFGPNAKYALHIANLEYQQGHYDAALDALRRVRDKTPSLPQDALYWRTYSELARLTRHDEDANFAYQRLLATGQAEATDLSGMSYFYQGYPIDAGRTAEMAFRKDGSARSLQSALYFYTVAHAWPRVRDLLASLTPAQRDMFDHSSALLAARADYERQVGQWDASLADLRRAASLSDASDDTKVSYLWALIDFGGDGELRQAMRRWRSIADANSDYWGAYGAGEVRLGDPARALKYLRRQVSQAQDDPLWLIATADAEAAAGHADVAWRLRRAAWRALPAKLAAPAAPAASTGTGAARSHVAALPGTPEAIAQARMAQVTLSQTFTNGDRSRDLLIALLKADRRENGSAAVARSLLGMRAKGLAPDLVMPDQVSGKTAQAAEARRQLISAAAKDVVQAWAISGEHNELARAWLAREYTDRLLQPADAQITLALADNDHEALARALAHGRGGVPVGSRIDALNRLGRTDEAETVAFRAVQGAPDNDELQESLRETLLRDRPALGADVFGTRASPLNSITSSLLGGVALTGRLALIIEAIQRNQHSADTSQLAWVPAQDRSFEATLRDHTVERDLSASVGHRNAVNSFYTFKVHGEFNRRGPLTTDITAGLNQFTDISPQMQVASTKDMLRMGALWDTQTRWFMQGSAEVDGFHAQDRTYLGRGVILAAELGYRLRLGYPDWNVRLTGERGIYTASGNVIPSLARLLPAGQTPTADQFMPQSVTRYGLMTGFGMDYENAYRHAWVPYLDVGVVHDSIEGWGPQVNVGLAGSIFGNDHARVYYSHEAVTGGGASVTQLGVAYRLYY
ncbi:tetratricopeptide repeat protein [Pandoraea sp.]|uniref:tetratricopeptide repeat protein n=1 Tax=Pandoraea sp. TaxID=1883445 RepID=UPI0011F4AF9B|nr:tetratricopeptide repeat protein [Pandoraea sp.]TAL53276.1 MAG: tetratricopeptide repeat protein [Pandoraea sp.]TAM16643.1 MAG: tetratricopeptide repeat protein [Pandoraea sp.]